METSSSPITDLSTRRRDSDLAVWIVEDTRSYREGLVYIINHTLGLHCSEIFFDYEEVEAKVGCMDRWEAPDVVLMDYKLPGRSGLEGISLLKEQFPEVSIIMLTVVNEEEVICEAFRAGASGYIVKGASSHEIVAAIWQVYKGGMLMPPLVAHRVMRYFTEAPPRTDYGLTLREKEVLQLMCQGGSYEEIAQALFISKHTVNMHVRHIYRKLHVHSGIEAVAIAYREGIL